MDWKTTDLKTFAQPLLGQQRAGFYINDYRREGMFRSSLLPFTLPRRETTRTTPSGKLAYFTYQLQKQFRPIRAGIQIVPPVMVKAILANIYKKMGNFGRSFELWREIYATGDKDYTAYAQREMDDIRNKLNLRKGR